MERVPKTLVVNADDFGLSNGTNRAIQSAFHKGILRSTSLMPNGEAFEEAVAIAKDTPGLGVGIHLSLVDEHCLAESARLRGLVSDNGSLPPTYAAFIKAFALRRFGVRHIREEIRVQVSRVLDAGITPTHIDSHQHLHIVPGVFSATMSAAQTAGIRVIRVPLERNATTVVPGVSRRWQIAALSLLCRLRAHQLHSKGFHVSDHFWGLAASGNMNESALSRVIESLQPGVNELMCHPGYSDEAMQSRYQWGYHWDEEAAALCSESIARMINDRSILLTNFYDAWKLHNN